MPNTNRIRPPDWNRSTFFWCERSPNEGETFTWRFTEPVHAESVNVTTGRLDNSGSDILEQGILQVSFDGQTFEKLADFKNGEAYADVKNTFRALRLCVTAENRGNWLIIRDPELK